MVNSVSCKIRSVIHFPYAKNMRIMEIHNELFAAYAQNIMSEMSVGQWLNV
jgi:hypothetical protein